MNLKEYQNFALSTAVYPDIGKNWHYPLIGLVGEIGELANKLKKSIRDDNDKITDKKREECIDELGDLQWYFVILCYELHIDPEFVLLNNISKLRNRKEKGTIHDTGGER